MTITADPIDVTHVTVADDLRALLTPGEDTPTFRSLMRTYSKRRLNKIVSGWPEVLAPAAEPITPDATPDDPDAPAEPAEVPSESPNSEPAQPGPQGD